MGWQDRFNGEIVQVDRERGYVRLKTIDNGREYFAHFSELRNVPHTCLLEAGLRCDFELGKSKSEKRQVEAVYVFIHGMPSLPDEDQVIVDLDLWDKSGFGFANLSCGCRVFIPKHEILTDIAYYKYLMMPGARVVFDVRQEASRKLRGALGLVAKRAEIMVPEGADFNEGSVQTM